MSRVVRDKKPTRLGTTHHPVTPARPAFSSRHRSLQNSLGICLKREYLHPVTQFVLRKRVEGYVCTRSWDHCTYETLHCLRILSDAFTKYMLLSDGKKYSSFIAFLMAMQFLLPNGLFFPLPTLHYRFLIALFFLHWAMIIIRDFKVPDPIGVQAVLLHTSLSWVQHEAHRSAPPSSSGINCGHKVRLSLPALGFQVYIHALAFFSYLLLPIILMVRIFACPDFDMSFNSFSM